MDLKIEHKDDRIIYTTSLPDDLNFQMDVLHHPSKVGFSKNLMQSRVLITQGEELKEELYFQGGNTLSQFQIKEYISNLNLEEIKENNLGEKNKIPKF